MNRIALVIASGAALAGSSSALPSAGAGGAAHDFAVGGGHLRVAFCAEDVVRVAFARDVSFFDRPSLAAGVRRCDAVRVERTDAGGTGDPRHREDEGPREPRHGEGRVPRRAGRAGPRREGGRALARAGRGPGGEGLPRPPGVGRERGRVALRPRPAPARPAGREGVRPRALAAQRDRGRALPRLQPRLRHPLGQPVVHPLRRPARVGSHPGGPAPRRVGEARRPDRLVPRGGGLREARRHARRPGDRHRDPGRDEAAEPADPPLASAGGGDQRAVGGRGRGGRERRPPVPALLERRDPDVGGRPAGRRPLAPGLAAVEGHRPRASREGAAPPPEDRVVEGPGDGDGAAAVEDAGEGAKDVAVVRGRRRRRLLVRLRPEPRPRHRRLPAAHRRGADDAALGLRPLAEPPALRDAAAEPRRGRRLPLATDPVRQHRAGLVLLAGDRVGLAPLRPRALPRPRRLGARRSTTGTRGS